MYPIKYNSNLTQGCLLSLGRISHTPRVGNELYKFQGSTKFALLSSPSIALDLPSLKFQRSKYMILKILIPEVKLNHVTQWRLVSTFASGWHQTLHLWFEARFFKQGHVSSSLHSINTFSLQPPCAYWDAIYGLISEI